MISLYFAKLEDCLIIINIIFRLDVNTKQRLHRLRRLHQATLYVSFRIFSLYNLFLISITHPRCAV